MLLQLHTATGCCVCYPCVYMVLAGDLLLHVCTHMHMCSHMLHHPLLLCVMYHNHCHVSVLLGLCRVQCVCRKCVFHVTAACMCVALMMSVVMMSGGFVRIGVTTATTTTNSKHTTAHVMCAHRQRYTSTNHNPCTSEAQHQRMRRHKSTHVFSNSSPPTSNILNLLSP